MSDDTKDTQKDTDAPKEERSDTKVDEKEKAEAQEEKVEEKQEEAPKEDTASDDNASDGEDVEVPEKFAAIVEGIEQMSVLDLHELVKLLEKKFGVSAAAVAVAGAGAAAEGAEEEEKSEMGVELKDAGAQKIAVIKVVKAALGLGLKEAKELVDSAPAMLKESMPKEEAEELKGQIEEAGGSVELK